MPLPEQDSFERLLASMTPVRPAAASEFQTAVLVPSSASRDEAGYFVEDECAVWYRASEALTFDALVTRVEKELQARRHKADRPLALCTICLFTLFPRHEARAVATFNRVLDTICDADLSQFFVGPFRCLGKIETFQMGSFTIGTANLARIEHRTKKAGSPDFFARWRQGLEDRFTVERSIVQCHALGIPTLREATLLSIRGDSERERVWELCVTGYFHSLALAYARDFWDDLLESQHLLIAAGAPYVDERVIRMLFPSQMVSIFQNLEGMGYVAPIGQSAVIVELARADRRVPEVVRDLRDRFGFTTFKDTDVHHSLHAFALFLSKARRHDLDGRSAEAFLHYVIALDLLFGEQDASTSSVARRTAVVIHGPLSVSIGNAQKMINRLYDLRSKYVHRGVETGHEEIVHIARICREVLFALLRLQARIRQGDTIAGWLKNLDYIYSAADAGRVLSCDELEQNGIEPPSCKPQEP